MTEEQYYCESIALLILFDSGVPPGVYPTKKFCISGRCKALLVLWTCSVNLCFDFYKHRKEPIYIKVASFNGVPQTFLRGAVAPNCSSGSVAECKSYNFFTLCFSNNTLRPGRPTTEQIFILQQIFVTFWENAMFTLLSAKAFSIRACPSGNAVGSVEGVRCWRPPVTGRQVNAFLLRSLCPCRES